MYINVDICYTNFFIKNKNKLSSFRKKNYQVEKYQNFTGLLSTLSSFIPAKTLLKIIFLLIKYEILAI